MGKTTITFVMVMTGVMLLFYFAGLVDNTINSTLLDILLDPENMRDSAFGNNVSLVFLAIEAVSVVVLGFLTKNTELVARGTFTIYLFNLMWDFIQVFNVVYSEQPFLAVIFFAPILFTFIINLVDFWGGRD